MAVTKGRAHISDKGPYIWQPPTPANPLESQNKEWLVKAALFKVKN